MKNSQNYNLDTTLLNPKEVYKTYYQNGQWGMIKGACGSSKLFLPNSELFLIIYRLQKEKNVLSLILWEIQNVKIVKCFAKVYLF